jgi:paraquat-inducible protein A
MLLPWAMSEVFLMGVLVALIKIAAMAKIVLGMAFWAYIFFAVMFLRLVSIADTHRLWGWVEGEVPEPKK